MGINILTVLKSVQSIWTYLLSWQIMIKLLIYSELDPAWNGYHEHKFMDWYYVLIIQCSLVIVLSKAWKSCKTNSALYLARLFSDRGKPPGGRGGSQPRGRGGLIVKHGKYLFGVYTLLSFAFPLGSDRLYLVQYRCIFFRNIFVVLGQSWTFYLFQFTMDSVNTIKDKISSIGESRWERFSLTLFKRVIRSLTWCFSDCVTLWLWRRRFNNKACLGSCCPGYATHDEETLEKFS